MERQQFTLVILPQDNFKFVHMFDHAEAIRVTFHLDYPVHTHDETVYPMEASPSTTWAQLSQREHWLYFIHNNNDGKL